MASCNTALAQITALQQMAVEGYLHGKARPFGTLTYGRAQRLPQLTIFPKSLRLTGEISFCTSVIPPGTCRGTLASVLSVIVCVVGGAAAIGQGEAAGDRPSHGTAVFDHPFAAALLVTLMVATTPTSPVPVTVKRLFEIAGLSTSPSS